MSFRRKHMLILITSLILLLLTACSGTSASVKDGKIELSDASLDFGDNTIPSTSKTKLTALKLKDEEKPDGLASTLFELELDVACSKPVTLSIPLTDEEIPDDTDAQPMIGLGNELNLSDGSVKSLYSYIPAEIENGILTATFIPAEYLQQLKVNGASGSAQPSNERLRLGVFWCSTIFEDGGHFIVYFPAQSGKFFINYNDRSKLLTDLEGVYNDYLNKGYVYGKRSNWPIQVNIQSLDEMGYYSYGWNGAEGKIFLNRNLFKDGYQANSVSPLLAHEFFHFVQLNYVESSNDNTWFDEATATYYEGEKSGSVPSIVAEYNEKIFSGVFPEENSAANGYARMPLIKYLSKKIGESFILNAYTLAGSGADWDSALLSSTGPAASWAADFYESLVKGEISNYAPYTLHSNIASGGLTDVGTTLALQVPTEEEIMTIVENDEIPNLGETTINIDSYGAQLVALTIDDTNLFRVEKETNPTVTVDGGADLRVFAIHGSNVSVLKSSGGSVKINDFKKSCEEDYVYLALVTGLHDNGKQSYTLKIELPPYPTLDELVGKYENGTLTFKDVYISPEFRAAAASDNASEEDEDSELGCDIDIDTIEILEALKGKTQQMTLVIAKTGESSGTLTLVDKDNDTSEPLAFTYQNGILTFDVNIEDGAFSGELIAAYGKNKDITIDGDLCVSEGNDIRIDLYISGSKPLGEI